jgi:hypothetical protein
LLENAEQERFLKGTQEESSLIIGAYDKKIIMQEDIFQEDISLILDAPGVKFLFK